MIGIVCGLKSEAEALGRALPAEVKHVRIEIAGASALRAEACADTLCDAGARLLLSVGLAGALDSSLASGMVVTARAVHLADGMRMSADPGLLALLVQGTANPLPFEASFGADEAIGQVARKKSLSASGSGFSECGFVDMETHGVARAANRHRRPWAALRAIADDATTPLPEWTLGSVRADGSIDLSRPVLGLMRRPLDLPLALRLAQANKAALAALSGPVATAIAELARL